MNIADIAKDKTLCCGCGACAAICPLDAILMAEDETGQAYPCISAHKCVDCSLCAGVCCVKNEESRRMPRMALAASYKDKDISAKSSSGGIFAALAQAVLAEGGVVYGTAFTEDFHAEVTGIESAQELYRLQGSKYVKSAMGQVYAQIKAHLESGRAVLFSGVPCQVAALRQYLGGDGGNLITVDIVCHGTPSNKLFLDYLKLLEKKKKKQIAQFYFRDKRYGQDVKGSVAYRRERPGKAPDEWEPLKAYRSSYYKLFLEGVSFRECCYSCKFAAPERVGDISLCDYWGVEQVHPDFVKQLKAEGLCGISAVMVNTDKGEALMAQIGDQLLKIDTDYQAVRQHNAQLVQASLRSEEHDKVMALYAREGYEAVDRYYFERYRARILVSTLGQFLPEKTKRWMLKMKRRLWK